MDILSDVLRAIRLDGAIYFDVRVAEPFAAATPKSRHIAPSVMPDAGHVIAFHVLLDGTCWSKILDGSAEPVRLHAGDVIVFPRGDPHVLCSDPELRAEPDMALYYRPADRPLPFVLNQADDGPRHTRFVCGYLGCDANPFNPLLGALPAMLHFAHCAERGETEISLIRLAVEESRNQRAGGESVLAKLSELLFIHVLRRYTEELPDDAMGWLSGLRDRYVGAALHLIHAEPANDWTVDQLARRVGLSRSAFADRFSHFVGMSPMRYLGQWRMQLATHLLERPGMTIARAAEEVGYRSEEGFNRAFKKALGAPPGTWRRSQAQ